jgi:uncharacterized protein involved in propanediol utilization
VHIDINPAVRSAVTPFRTRLFAEASVSTHYGEFGQGEVHDGESTVRALITLPCTQFRCTVSVELTPLSPEIHVEPADCKKVGRAVRFVLDRAGLKDWGAVARVSHNVPEGIGAGSSTGDVAAAMFATADAANYKITDADVARLAQEVEVACDPTMFRDDLIRLFAQRRGQTLKVLGDRFPPIWVVGVLEGDGVDTVAMPPARYSEQQIFEFDYLFRAFGEAIARGSVGELGALATRFAEINQEFLHKKNFEMLRATSRRCGAAGVAVSHSGSAFSFIFDAADPRLQDHLADLRAELAAASIPVFVEFAVGGPANGSAPGGF